MGGANSFEPQGHRFEIEDDNQFLIGVTTVSSRWMWRVEKAQDS